MVRRLSLVKWLGVTESVCVRIFRFFRNAKLKWHPLWEIQAACDLYRWNIGADARPKKQMSYVCQFGAGKPFCVVGTMAL